MSRSLKFIGFLWGEGGWDRESERVGPFLTKEVNQVNITGRIQSLKGFISMGFTHLERREILWLE
jgi:hypothetical protein